MVWTVEFDTTVDTLRTLVNTGITESEKFSDSVECRFMTMRHVSPSTTAKDDDGRRQQLWLICLQGAQRVGDGMSSVRRCRQDRLGGDSVESMMRPRLQ